MGGNLSLYYCCFLKGVIIMKKSKKTLSIVLGVIVFIFAILRLGASVISLTGLGSSVEKQAKKLVSANLNRHQTSGVQGSGMQSLIVLLGQAGFSDSDQEKVVESFDTMMKKMTYSINSCAVDPNDENIYIVNAELKTVDGEAIFIDNVSWDEIVGTLIEDYKRGDHTEEDLQQKVVEQWGDYILEKSNAAEATKTSTVDFEVQYDKETKSFYGEVAYNQLLGLSEDFEQRFAAKIGELEETLNSSFALDDYVGMLNEVYKKMDTEYLSFACATEGKTLIFTCTFKMAGVTKEDATSVLESESSAFENLISQIKSAGIPCDKILFEYRGIDNELLVSKEAVIE